MNTMTERLEADLQPYKTEEPSLLRFPAGTYSLKGHHSIQIDIYQADRGEWLHINLPGAVVVSNDDNGLLVRREVAGLQGDEPPSEDEARAALEWADGWSETVHGSGLSPEGDAYSLYHGGHGTTIHYYLPDGRVVATGPEGPFLYTEE